MEENNQNFNYQPYSSSNSYQNANVFDRWLNPGFAEMGEFERENYLMDKGNAFNEYMFNKTNEWNSARAQMQRGIEAGINPMLLAAGIAGTGATATPMQSQGASVGMNQQAANPLEQLGVITNGIDKGLDATDKLGKLIGFGKENKLNQKIAYNTAAKLGTEIHANNETIKRLRDSFKDFLREAKANADVAEQNFKNLQQLYENYKAEKTKIEEDTNLVREEINTQKEETTQKTLQNEEMMFKKAFRELFGVQLNDSDASMLAQLMLNGHGEELINAISNMFKSIKNEFTTGHSLNPMTNEENEIYDTMYDKVAEEMEKKGQKSNWMPKWLFKWVMWDAKHKYGHSRGKRK